MPITPLGSVKNIDGFESASSMPERRATRMPSRLPVSKPVTNMHRASNDDMAWLSKVGYEKTVSDEIDIDTYNELVDYAKEAVSIDGLDEAETIAEMITTFGFRHATIKPIVQAAFQEEIGRRSIFNPGPSGRHRAARMEQSLLNEFGLIRRSK